MGAAKTATAGTPREIVRVPDLGDFHDVEVVEVLVAVGDRVAPETPLCTLETDKATMDVPSPLAGTVTTLHVAKGSRVSAGDPVCEVATEGGGEAAPAATEGGGEAAPAATDAPRGATPAPPATTDAPRGASPSPSPSPTPTPSPSPSPTPTPTPTPSPSATPAAAEAAAMPERAPHAGPAVRRLARELGVGLAAVRGTGRKGRITREDVQAFVKARLAEPRGSAGAGIPPLPEIDFARFGPVETVPLSTVRRVAAAHLHRAWLHVPHVTQHDEADVTDLLAFLAAEAPAAQGVKLTPLAFVCRALAPLLLEMPRFNSSLAPDGQSLVLKRYVSLGIAVDTEQGLVVPVLRDVVGKGVLALAGELAELGRRARERRLRPEDLQGGTFSVSNLGGIGGTAFTPIVNAPEVAILGLSRTRVEPRWDGGAFVPRTILPLSLSYDHRVIDGADAARFTRRLAALLGDLRRLVL